MKKDFRKFENIWGSITTKSRKRYVIIQEGDTYYLYLCKCKNQYFYIDKSNDPIKLIQKIEQ